MRFRVVEEISAGGYLHNSDGKMIPMQDLVPKIGSIIEGDVINNPIPSFVRRPEGYDRGISYIISTGPGADDEKSKIFIPIIKLEPVGDKALPGIAPKPLIKRPLFWGLLIISAVVALKTVKP